MLGVGLYSLSGAYGKKDPCEVKKMLLKAVEFGVDYFDVAPLYGEAEELVGRVLKPYRNKIKVATKGGIAKSGKPDGSYWAIVDGCKASLKNLQTGFIDHFQIHFVDPETPVSETLQGLEELKSQGLIGSYGLGHFSREKIEEYCHLGDPSSILFEASPLNTKEYKKYQDFWREKGLSLMAMGVTGRGFLSGNISRKTTFPAGDIRNRDPLFHPELGEWRLSVLQKLKSVGEEYGKTPIQVAINWVSGLPGIDRILVGPSSWAHLKENLDGLGWEMGERDKEELNGFIQRKNLEKEQISREKARFFLGKQVVGFRDLLFVIETLYSLDLIGEGEAHKFFRKMLQSDEKKEKLEEMRVSICDRYLEKLIK